MYRLTGNDIEVGRLTVKDPFTMNFIEDLSPRYLTASGNSRLHVHLIGSFCHLVTKDFAVEIDGKRTDPITVRLDKSSVLIETLRPEKSLRVIVTHAG